MGARLHRKCCEKLDPGRSEQGGISHWRQIDQRAVAGKRSYNSHVQRVVIDLFTKTLDKTKSRSDDKLSRCLVDSPVWAIKLWSPPTRSPRRQSVVAETRVSR